jgi:ubiquitin carboxyl-terminal hydrolase 8
MSTKILFHDSLITTANKLFEQAVKLRDQGDAELSYVSFMKYLNLVSSIRKTADYRRDEKFYNNLLGTKNVQSAIENCEKLQKNLQRRYADREEENRLRLKLQQLDIKDKLEDEAKEKRLKEKSKENEETNSKSSLDVHKQVPSSTPTNIISTWEFDSMIKQKSTSFVIFDVRSREDFAASHIKHPNCFSIPEGILKPG